MSVDYTTLVSTQPWRVFNVGASATTTVIPVANRKFQANQWQGAAILFTDTGYTAWVSSNNSNALTIFPALSSAPSHGSTAILLQPWEMSGNLPPEPWRIIQVGSGATTTVIPVTGRQFQPNQWAGGMLSMAGDMQWILSNDTTSLTLAAAISPAPSEGQTGVLVTAKEAVGSMIEVASISKKAVTANVVFLTWTAVASGWIYTYNEADTAGNLLVSYLGQTAAVAQSANASYAYNFNVNVGQAVTFAYSVNANMSFGATFELT